MNVMMKNLAYSLIFVDYNVKSDIINYKSKWKSILILNLKG